MDEEQHKTTRWERRESKRLAKKRFTNDNRRSVRWLYWNSGQKKTNKERSNANTPSDML